MHQRATARAFSGLTLALAAACGPHRPGPAAGQPAGPARRPTTTTLSSEGWAAHYGLPSPGGPGDGAPTTAPPRTTAAEPGPAGAGGGASSGSAARDAPDGGAPWAGCGRGDAALAGAARVLAEHLARGEPLPDPETVTFEVRRRGGAFVGLRWWSRAGVEATVPEAAASLAAWAAARPPAGARYCDGARLEAPRPVLVALSADAPSTLDPVPTSVRLGQWVELTGEAPGAAGVRLVVLDPAGPPRSVSGQRDGARWRFRVAPRAPGPWLLQVVVDGERGPLPALEALLHAGTPPPATPEALVAAGEAAALGSVDERDALARMASAARQGEHLPPLRRDPALDALASDHARAMRDAGVLGHDVGQGDPTARAASAGETGAVGENVAKARTAVGAHRAWWRSPSHRGNLLDPRYRRLGVGAVRGADGALWAVLTLGE